jgi:hypothetical protein
MSTAHERDVFAACTASPRLDETALLELGERPEEALREDPPALAPGAPQPGPLQFIPFTPAQLQLAIEALGSHAGRLVDEAGDPAAYVPFAELQSHLHRYTREA